MFILCLFKPVPTACMQCDSGGAVLQLDSDFWYFRDGTVCTQVGHIIQKRASTRFLIAGKSRCQFCKKDFHPQSLSRHIARTHTEQDMLECQHCGKSYKGDANLKEHMRIVHKVYQNRFWTKLIPCKKGDMWTSVQVAHLPYIGKLTWGSTQGSAMWKFKGGPGQLLCISKISASLFNRSSYFSITTLGKPWL